MGTQVERGKEKAGNMWIKREKREERKGVKRGEKERKRNHGLYISSYLKLTIINLYYR